MDDVAYIKCGNIRDSVYAIKKDKTLWRWGNGIYAPEKIADDTVNVWQVLVSWNFSDSVYDVYYLTSDGKLFKAGTDKPILYNVKDALLNNYSLVKNEYYNYDYIVFSDNTLLRFARGTYTEGEKILENVNRIFDFSSRCYAILENGECWGWGSNEHSRLGDGTVIDRAEPVFIMNNVEFILLDKEAAAIECRSVWGGYETVFYLNDGTALRTSPDGVLQTTTYLNLVAGEKN